MSSLQPPAWLSPTLLATGVALLIYDLYQKKSKPHAPSHQDILALDHFQMAIPHGGEDQGRKFWCGALGFIEHPKPAHLVANNGGCWFQLDNMKVHLGVDNNFVPAKQAHPAFIVRDVRGLAKRLEQAGYTIFEDKPLAGYDRLYCYDPFGNRVELMQVL